MIELEYAQKKLKAHTIKAKEFEIDVCRCDFLYGDYSSEFYQAMCKYKDHSNEARKWQAEADAQNAVSVTLVETFFDEEKTKPKPRYFINQDGLGHGQLLLWYENGQLE